MLNSKLWENDGSCGRIYVLERIWNELNDFIKVRGKSYVG